MAKRIFTLLIIVFLIVLPLADCDSEEAPDPTVPLYSDIFQSGVYYDKDWDSSLGTYQGDTIPNPETALAVAQAIYNAIPGEGSVGRIPIGVFFDEPEQIWIVSFGYPPYNGVYTLGGGCDIALRKSDGQVVRIWFTE